MSPPDPHTLQVQQMFIRHAPMLRGVVLGVYPDFDLADDVLQEVFLVVTEKAHTFEIGTNFPAWAGQIARRKVLEVARRYRSRQQGLSPEVLELLIQEAPEASETCASNEKLRDCVNKLAPRARQLIRMRYRDDCKPAEIARELDLQPEAVYVTLSRARNFLKDCLSRSAETDAG